MTSSRPKASMPGKTALTRRPTTRSRGRSSMASAARLNSRISKSRPWSTGWYTTRPLRMASSTAWSRKLASRRSEVASRTRRAWSWAARRTSLQSRVKDTASTARATAPATVVYMPRRWACSVFSSAIPCRVAMRSAMPRAYRALSWL